MFFTGRGGNWYEIDRIKPEGTVTEEDLYNFGARYKLDFILIGTVTKRRRESITLTMFITR